MVNEKRERRYDLDWLRVIAILLVLGFHTGMIYVRWGWHIKSPDTSMAMETVMAWLHHWRMPLLLFISGAGTCFALGFRSPGTYVKERVKRLLIPLVFGMFIIVPPQIYYEFIEKFRSYLDFYPTVFEFVPYPEGSFSWHHLWFILYLLVFSVLALPVFLFLRSAKAQGFYDRIVKLLSHRGGFALFLIPMILSQFALRPLFPHETHDLVKDWAYFALYFSYFFYGYLCCRDGRIMDLMEKKRREHLIVALVALVPFYLAYFIPYKLGFFQFDFIYGIPCMVIGWYWVLTCIGYGRRYLNRNTPILKHANEAIYPFYILHQTVIVMIGYTVIRRLPGVWLSFFVVLTLSFLVSVGVYLAFVRPFNPMRLVFGMKPKPRAAEGNEPWAILRPVAISRRPRA